MSRLKSAQKPKSTKLKLSLTCSKTRIPTLKRFRRIMVSQKYSQAFRIIGMRLFKSRTSRLRGSNYTSNVSSKAATASLRRAATSVTTSGSIQVRDRSNVQGAERLSPRVEILAVIWKTSITSKDLILTPTNSLIKQPALFLIALTWLKRKLSLHWTLKFSWINQTLLQRILMKGTHSSLTRTPLDKLLWKTAVLLSKLHSSRSSLSWAYRPSKPILPLPFLRKPMASSFQKCSFIRLIKPHRFLTLRFRLVNLFELKASRSTIECVSKSFTSPPCWCNH